MKERRLIFIIILFFITLYCCKKPKEFPNSPLYIMTVSPYFPCYPKSYWMYLDSSGIISTIKVDDEYVEYRIKTDDDTINAPALFPIINGSYYFDGFKIIRVKGQNNYTKQTYEYDIFEPVVIMRGESDFLTQISYPWIQAQSYEKSIDSLMVNGILYDTIEVNKILFNDVNKPYPILRYFSKNVGLILEQVIYHQDSIPDTVTVKSLTGYQIFKD